MMTQEENQRLTRVARGTPGGEMLRRYWWPVWFSERVQIFPSHTRRLAAPRKANGGSQDTDRT